MKIKLSRTSWEKMGNDAGWFKIATDESLTKEETPAAQTFKKYRCKRCGHIEEQKTNHYGPTWSWGHVNVCPKCPPFAKYPEFGGRTDWECIDAEPTNTSNWNTCSTCGEKGILTPLEGHGNDTEEKYRLRQEKHRQEFERKKGKI